MKNLSLEERIQRMEDVHQIQNLMGKYSYFHTADMQEETVALWAKHTPNTWVDVPSFGYYEGYEGLRRCYVGAHQSRGEEARIGGMHMHTLTTPVIEVAADGKTAKGVWISPGHETGGPPGQKPQAFWAWLKYGADFVREDGEWKLWHMRVFGIFFTPYDKGWVECNISEAEPLPDQYKSDVQTEYWTNYKPTAKTVLVPVPPEPYDTWNGKSCAGEPPRH